MKLEKLCPEESDAVQPVTTAFATVLVLSMIWAIAYGIKTFAM